MIIIDIYKHFQNVWHANQQNAQHHVNSQSPLSLKPNAEKLKPKARCKLMPL